MLSIICYHFFFLRVYLVFASKLLSNSEWSVNLSSAHPSPIKRSLSVCLHSVCLSLIVLAQDLKCVIFFSGKTDFTKDYPHTTVWMNYLPPCPTTTTLPIQVILSLHGLTFRKATGLSTFHSLLLLQLSSMYWNKTKQKQTNKKKEKLVVNLKELFIHS